MALFHSSSASFNHLHKLSPPSLPPKLCTLTKKVIVPNTSSFHKIFSSSLLRSNQLSSDSFFYQRNDQNITDFGGSENLKTRGSTSSVKVSSKQIGDMSEDKSLTSITKMNMLDLAVRFVRPYIVIGTLISFLATTARAYFENLHLTLGSVLTWSLPLRGILVLSALLAVDAYIMVMNQISDVEIDRINKPYLPLANGEISLRESWSFVISCAVHSIATAVFLDLHVMLPLVLLLLAFGTIYSVRPFYAKRSTFGAIIICASMRGYAGTLLHYAAACATLGVRFRLSPAVVFLSVFSTLIGLSLGVMKDLPDLEGDKKCNVKTLALIIGAEKTSLIGFGFLFLAYVGGTAAAMCLPTVFRSSIMVPAHMLLGCYVAFQGWKLVKANYSKEASKSFFHFLWMLLDAENIIFPVI